MKLYHINYDYLNFDDYDNRIKSNFIDRKELGAQNQDLINIKNKLESINKRLSDVLDNFHSAVVIVERTNDDTYILADFNKKARRIDNLFDIDKGRDVTDVYPNIQKSGLLDKINDVIKYDIPLRHRGEYEYDGSRGGYRDLYIYKIASNNKYEVVIIYDDISRCVDIKNALKTVFHMSYCPMVVVDYTTFTIKMINEAALKFVGYEKDELVEETLFNKNIIYDMADGFIPNMEKYGRVEDLDVICVSKTGKELKATLNTEFIKISGITYLLMVLLPYNKNF